MFLKARLAVFVDGCFWHGCPEHGVLPKSNRPFWQSKLQGNQLRDRKNVRILKELGWKVVRIWEHEIESDVAQCAEMLGATLKRLRELHFRDEELVIAGGQSK